MGNRLLDHRIGARYEVDRDPEHHRSPAGPDIRRPDVQRQAVLALAAQLCKGLGYACRVGRLKRLRPKRERIKQNSARPQLWSHRRLTGVRRGIQAEHTGESIAAAEFRSDDIA